MTITEISMNKYDLHVNCNVGGWTSLIGGGVVKNILQIQWGGEGELKNI